MLVPPDQLHNKKAKIPVDVKRVLDKCHIYLITRRPALSFDPSTFVYSPSGSTGDLVRKVNGVIEKTPFRYKATTEPGGRVEVGPYPHRELISYNKSGALTENHWPASILAQMTTMEDRSFIDLEVVYVGQAYGQGHRSALDRLRNHETLQRVLAESAKQSPDDELLIVMAQYEPHATQTAISGSASAQITGDADTEHLLDLLKHPLTGREQVGLAEAALIRYFTPEYNEKFKYNFPASRQLVLDSCYKKDFSGLVVEINTEELRVRLYSENRAPGYHHISTYDFHDTEKRQSFFSLTDKSGGYAQFDISGPAY